MFSLLFGFLRYIFSKQEYYVLILGVDNAGKTSLLEKVKSIFQNIEGLPPDRICPTVGLNIGRLDVDNVKVIMWDLGGQVSLRSIWDKYFRQASGLVFVVDAADETKLEDARSTIETLLHSEDLQGVPLLLMANKQDLPHARSPSEIVRHLEIERMISASPGAAVDVSNGSPSTSSSSSSLALTPGDADGVWDRRKFRAQGVSALNGKGLRDGIQWLVERIKENPPRTIPQ
eukprot:TRINITY_DN721_c0_g1_i1.p1 TRINITY_DN721_c0_g1~~TRINITY_DN721_c0_g1_i1.p1  ORF type:complete len:231 (-),score=27.79 TRINITY_DN721_c0_g1_i1:88-780(-)